MENYRIEKLISRGEIEKAVVRLARQIEEECAGEENIVLVGLLRGSFVFLADLMRAIHLSVRVDFMEVSSYGNSMESSRDVRILKDMEEDVRGLNVIVVEDIVDTGCTLSEVCDYIRLKGPNSLKVCTLLNKPDRRVVEVAVDYCAFDIPDVFVVGYGIDFAQSYRNLPYVAKVVMKGDSEYGLGR